MFLTTIELIELTGYKYKAKQRDWLIESGFRFSVRCDGCPSVLRSHVEKILGGNIPKPQKYEQPNIDGLKNFLYDKKIS